MALKCLRGIIGFANIKKPAGLALSMRKKKKRDSFGFHWKP